MPTTAKFLWPTPASVDPNDVPADTARLATKIEETVDGLTTFPFPRRLSKGGTTSVSNNTETLIAGWTPLDNDPGNVTDGITYLNGVFTIPTPGDYIIGMGSLWPTGNSAGTYYLAAYRNATAGEKKILPAASSHSDTLVTLPIRCAAGDGLSIRVTQTSGGSLSFGGSTTACWYACARVA